MKKKRYIQPETVVSEFEVPNLLQSLSKGTGTSPGEAESKGFKDFDDESFEEDKKVEPVGEAPSKWGLDW